jgi:uncharacterized protein (DUF427 family)
VNARTAKIPGPDHPIRIVPSDSRVVVRVASATLIDTRRALFLHEASYPPVLYLPREDADMSQFERSVHSTYCPYKGDCSYYSIPQGGAKSVDAVWTYETPYSAVAQIRNYLAFYPSRVDSIETTPG